MNFRAHPGFDKAGQAIAGNGLIQKHSASLYNNLAAAGTGREVESNEHGALSSRRLFETIGIRHSEALICAAQ